MKKFTVVQEFDAPASLVIDVFRREETWRGFADLPFVGTPAVGSFVAGDVVHVEAAYRVSLDLPALARTFIDPDRLTFVEITRLDDVGGGVFEIRPDHYSSMLSSAGTTRVTPLDGGYCKRTVTGTVEVSLGWKGALFEAPVEDAIVGGLQKALRAQAEQLDLA